MKKVLRFCVAAYAVFLFFAATVPASQAQSFTTLVNFDGTDGAGPDYGSLIQGFDGNFYGTTVSGGTNCAPTGCGTVFKMSPSGILTTLHSFTGAASEGVDPENGLVQGTDGNFYGTTFYGGSTGGGTVFKITPGGVLTTLYSFCAQSGCSDGVDPVAGLVQARDGNFYGSAIFGGASTYCSGGCGTLFKITSAGTFTTLYQFDLTHGSLPSGVLVQGTDESLYGTTEGGGANGKGTVFKITTEGALTTLYSFGGADGQNPYAGLVQASDGDFYGTTITAEVAVLARMAAARFSRSLLVAN